MKDQQLAETLKKLDNVRELLAFFQVKLIGFDPGVLAIVDSKKPSLDFSAFEWEWLEPLLIELKEFRNAKKNS